MFRRIYQSLLAVIATATQKEPARQVRYLKVENELLRSRFPTRISLTDKEKSRLCRFAEKLGRSFDSLATIVHPDNSPLAPIALRKSYGNGEPPRPAALV